jgi:hypothetical protein
MAIEPIDSAQEGLGKNLKAFNKTTAGFAVATAGLGTVASKFLKSSTQFKDSMATFAKTFTIANTAKSLEQVASKIHEIRLDMNRQYALNGREKFKYIGLLQREERVSLEYGQSLKENFLAFKALSAELKDFRFIENNSARSLISTTNLISQAFQVSEEASAQMVANLSLFQGKDSKEITSFFEMAAGASKELGVSHRDVAESLAKSSSLLYRFNIRSNQMSNGFAKTAAWTQSIGVELDEMLTTTSKFRHIDEAVRLSARASALGFQVNPTELFASQRRGGDPAFLYKQLFGQFTSRGFDSQGGVTDVGVDLAEAMSGELGMSTEQFIKTATLYYKNNTDLSNVTKEDIRDTARRNQGFFERLDTLTTSFTTKFMNPFAKLVFPAVEAMLNTLGKIGDAINTLPSEITDGISYAMAIIFGASWIKMLWSPLIFLVSKLMIPFKMIMGSLGLFTGLGGAGEHLAEKGAQSINRGGLGSSIRRGGTKTKGFFSRQASKVKGKFGSFGRGRGTATHVAEDISSASKSLPNPAVMLAQGLQMIMFAGALFILAKAFQEFSSGVDFKGFMAGIVVMGIFTGAMILMSAAMTGASGPILAAIGLVVSFGASIWVVSKAAQNFTGVLERMQDVKYGVISKGIRELSLSILAFGGSNGLFGGIGAMASAGGIIAIGEFAKKYVDPITGLAKAINMLAKGLQDVRMEAESYKNLDLSSLEMSELTGKIINNGRNRSNDPIQIISRVDIDGKKAWAGISEAVTLDGAQVG